MTFIDYPAGPNFASEAPINLPSNRQDAAYGSDVIVELFGDLGFEHVFLTPGSSFRGIHDSLVNHTRNHKPEIILCAHEEIAVAMAQGYAKATGRPALVFLHDLVGVQHAVMAFYNAWADRMPVVVLGGAGPADPAERRRIDWIHSANTQCELVRNFTKWTDEPPTLQAVLDSVARARRIATSAPRGPTYVSIDTVIQESKLNGAVEMPDVDLPRYRAAPPLASPAEQVTAAADLLTGAEWPLVVGGNVGYSAAATRPMVELVEILGAPYKDGHDIVCIPTAHPHNMNGGFGDTGETEMRAMADVVIGVDSPDINHILGTYGKARGGSEDVSGEKQKRIIDISLNDLTLTHWSNMGGPITPVDVQLLADPMYALGQLLDELRSRAGGNPGWVRRARERAAEVATRHQALRARQRAAVEAMWDQHPISPARMTGELWEVVKNKDYLLALRNYRSWYEGIWEFDGAGRFLSNNVGGGVGYGPGGVIGSALAGKEHGKFTLAVLGDGDFTMGPAALWTAAHYRIPILIILHNNTSFGNDEEHQITLAYARERPVENAWIGQRMVGPAPDYATIAGGYGATGYGPIDNPNDLADAFRSAADDVEKGGVALVDVRTQLN